MAERRDAVSVLAKLIVAVMTLFVVYACTSDMQERDPQAFLKAP